MLRFAPSPTGDMHIGNLRAAILNFIVAKQKGEKFLIRIEDTDKARNIDGADKEILQILNLFGLFWDKLVYQSDNFKIHNELALQLVKKGQAFYCYATKEFLDKKRNEALAQKRAFRYDDSWAEICKSENKNPVIRLKGDLSTILSPTIAELPFSTSPSLAEGARGLVKTDKSQSHRQLKPYMKEFSREMRKNPTDAENKLWQELRGKKLGFRFRRQFVIDSKYVADFVCLEKRLIIECDGGGHSKNPLSCGEVLGADKDMLNHPDIQRDFYLESQNFRILRFWNNEILGNLEGVLSVIREALESSLDFTNADSTHPLAPNLQNSHCFWDFTNADSTHPLAPSAREGEQKANPSAREGEQKNIFHANEGGYISFIDKIKGECIFSQNEIDSFVIIRDDGVPTYNFACAVDDMIYDISFIIRGEDHTSNTPKQILVHKKLGYTKEIAYAHLPIILNDLGKKMSKRESESSVKWLLAQGFLPKAILNYLLLMGNNPPTEIFTLDEAIEWFDLSQLSKSPVRFDINQLRHINREHLKRLSEKEMAFLLESSSDILANLKSKSNNGEAFVDSLDSLGKIFLEESSTLNEIRAKIERIFTPKAISDDFTQYSAEIAVLKNALLDLVAQDDECLNDFNALKAKLSESCKIDDKPLKGKGFFMPLRFLLTGAGSGPHLDILYPHLKAHLAEILIFKED